MAYQGYSHNTGGFGGKDNAVKFEGESPTKGGKRLSKEDKSLTPVTCHMITEAMADENQGTENVFRFEGRAFGLVSVVGLVLSVAEMNSYIMLTLDDGTARIKAKLWLENREGHPSDDQAKKRADCQEGTYVRITGHIRRFQNENTIFIHQLVGVIDHNEISYHIADTIHGYALHKKQMNSMPNPNKAFGTGFAPTVTRAVIQNDNARSGGMSMVEQDVFNFIMREGASGEQGVHIHTIMNALSLTHPDNEVRKAVIFLCDEGHVYSTIDEDHFKAGM